MIKSIEQAIEQAIAVQERRAKAGKYGYAKAVIRFINRKQDETLTMRQREVISSLVKFKPDA